MRRAQLPRPPAAVVAALLLLTISPSALRSQADGGPEGTTRVDTTRVAQLYVSSRAEEHDPHRNHLRDRRAKAVTDSIYRVHAAGSYEFQKVVYRSSVGDLDIPAYVFQPLNKRGKKGHAALVWVHGGVHGDWSALYLPFVKEAVARGYVVIAPDFRGSTGYGEDFHNAIDYGGYEIDDVVSAYDYLRAKLPHVDPDRVAIMGWSHGGFIAAHSVFRETHPFRAAVAIVPVSNLIFRLSYKGPAYQALFYTQVRIGGLPFEKRDLYVERSPVFQVDKLNVPMLVHVATNDEDVDFIEAEMFVNTLEVKKPHLVETRVYENPPGGHSFTRLVTADFQAIDTQALQDSWSRTWAFLGWNLHPDEDGSDALGERGQAYGSNPGVTAASSEPNPVQ